MDEGKAKLAELEGDPALAAEHWAPECKLFSRARGRPVRLDDGALIAGPQPVRDAGRVVGFPWATPAVKVALWKPNDMALRGLKRTQGTFGQRRYVTVEHPYNSWLWRFSIVEELRQKDFEWASGRNCWCGGER